MASQDDNCSTSRQTRGEPPHAPKTPEDKGAKLLANAQRTAKASSKQRLGRLLLESEDNQDITIKRLQAQLATMAQVLVDNRLMKPPQGNEEPSRGKSGDQRDLPHGVQRQKQQESRVDLKGQDDSKSGASSKRRVSPC